jgi:hypothetical protein
MDVLVVPSGKYRYQVRKATFADQRERSRITTRDKWTYMTGSSMREAGYTSDDLIMVEIWSVTTSIEEASYDKEGNELWKPISLKIVDKRFIWEEFERWLGEQELEDVMHMHEAVVEKNPKWQ